MHVPTTPDLVAGVLLQIRVRVEALLRNREEGAVIAVGTVIEPRLRRVDAETDEHLTVECFGRELPAPLVEHAAELHVSTTIRHWCAAGAGLHDAIRIVPAVVVHAATH